MSPDCPPFGLEQAALDHGYVGSLLSVNDANGHALGQPPLRLTRGIARWTVPTARVHASPGGLSHRLACILRCGLGRRSHLLTARVEAS